MKTLKIHLIRHGATDANYKGQYIGCKTDIPLSPEGLNELRMMKDDVNYPEIQRLYSSPLLRAKQSGSVLYPDVPMFLVEDFKEYDGTIIVVSHDRYFINKISDCILSFENGEVKYLPAATIINSEFTLYNIKFKVRLII